MYHTYQGFVFDVLQFIKFYACWHCCRNTIGIYTENNNLSKNTWMLIFQQDIKSWMCTSDHKRLKCISSSDKNDIKTKVTSPFDRIYQKKRRNMPSFILFFVRPFSLYLSHLPLLSLSNLYSMLFSPLPFHVACRVNNRQINTF